MTPASRARRQVEVPVWLMTSAAWWVLLRGKDIGQSAAACCAAARSQACHVPAAMFVGGSAAALAVSWMLMLAAMMTPHMSAPVRHILDRSFARRRLRGVLLFLTGYVGVWLVAGAILLSVAMALRQLIPSPFLSAGLVLLVTAVWQCSPQKQRCLNRGHSHPALSAFGVAADLDALRFGVLHGVWCAGSCWALMLLPEMFARGHLAVMGMVTLYLLAERLERPIPPRWRVPRMGKAARLTAAQLGMALSRA